MKVKTFILTFLMMMSSPFLFGQHWVDPDLGTNNTMPISATITLDGELQTDESYQVAAFHGNTLLEVQSIIAFVIPNGGGTLYHVDMDIPYVAEKTQGIYFKLFNGINEYVSSTEIDWNEDGYLHTSPLQIEFQSVAQIEGTEYDVVYPSLQKAIDACKEGDNTIELLAKNAEDVTIKQVEGVNVTIDGSTSRYEYSGTITIHGNARHDGAETLTFQNINFKTDKAGHYFIDSNSTGSVERYAHNVTVFDCNFTATDAGVNSAVAMRIRQGFDIAINGSTFTNLHSALQAYGNAGITVYGITLNGKNGISAGTSTGVVIENSNITATGYGVRADGSGAYEMTLTDNTISAELPVVVRKAAEVAYNLTITGDNNNFTAENQGNNPEGYQVVFTTGDDGTYLAPTTGQFLLSVPENFNVYPVYVAQVGNLKYTSVVTAINEAADGATVQLLPGTIEEYVYPWPESNHSKEKSITIIGAENFGTTLTAGMYLGYDDSQCRNHTIVVEGIAFEGKGLTVACQENVTIKNNKFNNITDTRAIAVIGKDIKATVENNKIDGVQIGIELRNMAVATMTGNEVKNTTHNSVQVTAANPDADVTITDNTFENWGEEGEGRAIRVSGGDNIVVNNNKMVNDNAPESYVKITKVTETETQTIDVDKNYWNGNNPLALFETDGTNDPVSYIKGYYSDSDMNISSYITLAPSVAKIGDVYYQSLQAAINAATEGQTVTVINDVELESTVTVASGKVVTLDLNGKTISGVCNSGQGHMFMVQNTADLTVKDSSENKEGKITYARGTSNTGWVIDLEGDLILESGTIELTGDSWSIGYAVDVRPNSWGTEYTEGTTFTMKGGKLVSSDAAVRVASSSSDNHENVSANFIMNGGEIEAAWDGIFVQQSNTVYDILNVRINGGNIKSALPLRLYGPVATSVLNNVENPITLNITGGTFDYTGNDLEDNKWLVPGVIMIAGGATFDQMLDYTGFEITGGTFDGDVSAYCAFGYTCQANGDGTYGIVETTSFEIPNLDRLIAFRNAVNAGNTFENQTVTVTADINMESVANWTPIGTSANPFKGTFDGGNKTISNLVVEGENNVGLFGYATSATIKNVKINNANVKGTDCVGAIAGQVYSTSLIDNCHVSGNIKVEGNTNVGGIVGKYYTKVKNSSVIGDEVATSYVKGVHAGADLEGDDIGGIMGHAGENNTHENNVVKNITISGTRKVGGLIGVTDQNTDVTNCVVENVKIETTAEAQYAEDNKTKAGHASLVGSYTSAGANDNGTVTNCLVKNVEFVNTNNVVASFGPITGGARGGSEAMLNPTGVTASGNTVYMTTVTGSNNLFLMKAVAKIEETNYYTLDEAIAAANNQTVTVLENVELRNTLTIEAGKTVTLDLNGKTINTAWEDESAEKHYYAFDNKGTLTITDSSTEANGTINARGNFNYGTLTLEKGTINAIDHNGGYGVRNYEGSKFTMNGGLIATTNENGDIPGDGYDATTVRVDYDAEFIMNGGNINNISNFTIAIENYGTTTINENAGEVKSVHTTVANHGTMTINGGTFICDGLENITAHALWATPGSTTTINGGTFNGKDNYNGFNVDAEEGAVVEINGGKFESVHSGSLYGDGTITVKGGTFFDVVAENRLAPGYVCKQNTDGTYGVFLGVAKIEETGAIYGTLTAAIDAASAGNTIVLLADITENVTVNKNLTIDGKAEGATANSKYTGKMTVNSSLNINIRNIDFVKGYIDELGGEHGYFTIVDCNFDGVDKSIGYAVTVRGGDKLTIENSTAKNYSYGMLYIPSAVANIAIKDVEVSNVTAAFNISYSGDGTFENVEVDNVTYGLHVQNYGARTFTLKDCVMNNVDFPTYIQQKSTAEVTFEFNNVLGYKETINSGSNQAKYGKYVLTSTAAKLTNVADDFNVTVSDDLADNGYVVEYNVENGVGTYSVVAANVALYHEGELVKQFATIQEAIDAAQTGDVVRVLNDVTYTWDNVILNSNNYAVLLNVSGKDITLDMNGKKISVNHQSTTDRIYAVVYVEDGAGLTFTGEGTIDVDVDDNAPKVAYMFWKRGSTGLLTIENGTFHMDNSEDSMVYTNGSEIVKVNGGTFTLDKVGTRDNGFPHIFSTQGQNTKNITVNGGTFNADVLHQYYAFEVNSSVNNALVDNGNGTWTIVTNGAVAYVTERYTTFSSDYSNEVGYATLADAVAAANKYDKNGGWLPTITLLANVELENTITIAAGEEVILDLNGKTITGKDKYESGSFNLFVNNGTFEIKDGSAEGTGKITLEATTNRYWNASSSIVSNSAGTLTITSGTLEHLGGTDMAYGIDNNSTLGLTTLNVDGGKIASPYRAIRQFQNSLQDNVVVVNGGTISARAGIWMQQPSANDKAQLGTLTINDGSIFECVSNAVVIDICGGAQSNVTINGGTFSNTNENANLLLIWPLTDMNSVHENCSAVMNITGGNFTCAGEGNLIGILDGADTNGDVVLTGGIYSEDVNAYCAEGYGAIANATGTLWTVMPVQEQSLVKGWNWYSSYLNITPSALTTALGENGLEVKDQNDVSMIYDQVWGTWSGSLTLDFAKMYMINTTEACELKLAANVLNPAEHEVTLNEGWNWIGYPSNQSIDINTALANIPEPKNGDVIKTRNLGHAEYVEAWGGWIGQLTHMIPGEGYMYKNTSSGERKFFYNVESTRGTVEANYTAENNYWTPNVSKYPFNMTMTAVVDGMTDGNYEVAAFVNGEVRGSARPIYVEQLDAYVLFLTINGDEVEEMSFRLYDIDNDTEYDLNDRFNYSNNAHLGSVSEPYVFSRGTTGIGEAAMSNVNIYPNPTTIGTEINLEATCDIVEVYNALGVKVAEYQNVDTIDALETAGIYVIRITNNGNVQNCRLVVK